MRSCFIIGLIFISHFFRFSQGEFNNWYFGNKAGISFNSGSPECLKDGQMAVTRANVSVSDSLSNLLFYSDGQTVWNRNHQTMPNGTGLHGGIGQDQTVNVIQKIADAKIFLAFFSMFLSSNVILLTFFVYLMLQKIVTEGWSVHSCWILLNSFKSKS